LNFSEPKNYTSTVITETFGGIIYGEVERQA
jgi:hypothetical protein